jgi:hypothetical protein
MSEEITGVIDVFCLGELRRMVREERMLEDEIIQDLEDRVDTILADAHLDGKKYGKVVAK